MTAVQGQAKVQRRLQLHCEDQLWEMFGFLSPSETDIMRRRSDSWRKLRKRLCLESPKSRRCGSRSRRGRPRAGWARGGNLSGRVLNHLSSHIFVWGGRELDEAEIRTQKFVGDKSSPIRLQHIQTHRYYDQISPLLRLSGGRGELRCWRRVHTVGVVVGSRTIRNTSTNAKKVISAVTQK